MKTIALTNACYFRALTPRWAHDPLSGEGAAITGGRFNSVGYAALYFASDAAASLAEAQQSLLIMPPRTVCSYQISVANVIDFSGGYSGLSQPAEWSMWDCNWRHIWNVEGSRPPSWELADELISSGVAGLLFPSLRSDGAVNLVLFLGNLAASDILTFNDPDGDLPQNQLSWGRP